MGTGMPEKHPRFLFGSCDFFDSLYYIGTLKVFFFQDGFVPLDDVQIYGDFMNCLVLCVPAEFFLQGFEYVLYPGKFFCRKQDGNLVQEQGWIGDVFRFGVNRLGKTDVVEICLKGSSGFRQILFLVEICSEADYCCIHCLGKNI